MKTIINIIAGIFFLSSTCFAAELNYKLNITNITFTSEKTLEFDINLKSEGDNKEEFRYALGQYFLEVDPEFSNSGELTLTIVKSELPDNMKPASVSVSENIIRLSMNQINTDMKSLPVVPGSKPGLLVARMKLETSADKFSKDRFVLKWTGAESKFKTKIVAFSDDKLVEVTNTENHYTELDNNGNGTVENNSGLPKEFSLSQNYPNPFNPSTVIHYSLVENGFTNLKIFDITGKEVANLVNENQNAGRFDVTFNGSNFASGVYFYRIQSGSYSAVKRMFLIK